MSIEKEALKIAKPLITDYINKNKKLFYKIGFDTAKDIENVIKDKISGKPSKSPEGLKGDILEILKPVIDSIKNGFVDGIKDKLGIAVGSVAGISLTIFALGYLIGKKRKT